MSLFFTCIVAFYFRLVRLLKPTQQEEYIKDEMKNLKRELIRAKEEIKRIQSVPLVIGQFNEIIDANYGIVGGFFIFSSMGDAG